MTTSKEVQEAIDKADAIDRAASGGLFGPLGFLMRALRVLAARVEEVDGRHSDAPINDLADRVAKLEASASPAGAYPAKGVAPGTGAITEEQVGADWICVVHGRPRSDADEWYCPPEAFRPPARRYDVERKTLPGLEHRTFPVPDGFEARSFAEAASLGGWTLGYHPEVGEFILRKNEDGDCRGFIWIAPKPWPDVEKLAKVVWDEWCKDRSTPSFSKMKSAVYLALLEMCR